MEGAARFCQVFQGSQLASFKSSPKVCEVCPAKVQGRERNVAQYRKSAVMAMDEEYRPTVFENGVRMPFPAPPGSKLPALNLAGE